MNATKFKIYLNAYHVRLSRGEKLEDIDKDYLQLKKLKKEDIDIIHNKLRG